MSVTQHKAEDLFPNFDFDEFEKYIKDNILSKDPSIRIARDNRGEKSKNIYKDCKEHNRAVNADFYFLNPQGNFAPQINRLRHSLLTYYADCQAELRNTIWYKKNGYMGWHTNKYQTGDRVYLIWSEEDEKSSFDYYEKGKKKSILAPKGFSVNTFYCGEFERMFAHQVTSDCNRISIGFRLR